VLVHFSSTVIDSDFDSASSASVSFWWLLLILSEDLDMFVLICAHFTFVTVICCHIKRTETLVCHISYCLFVFFALSFFRFGSIVGESTIFLIIFFFFLGFLALSSFWIKSGNHPPL